MYFQGNKKGLASDSVDFNRAGTWLSRIFSHMFTDGFNFCSYRLSDTIMQISGDIVSNRQ